MIVWNTYKTSFTQLPITMLTNKIQKFKSLPLLHWNQQMVAYSAISATKQQTHPNIQSVVQSWHPPIHQHIVDRHWTLDISQTDKRSESINNLMWYAICSSKNPSFIRGSCSIKLNVIVLCCRMSLFSKLPENMSSYVRPFIVIREYRPADDIACRELIKNYVMSFATGAFVSCLFREVSKTQKKIKKN